MFFAPCSLLILDPQLGTPYPRSANFDSDTMLLLYVRQFTKLQKRQASNTKMLEASASSLQKEGDMVSGEASGMILMRSRIASSTF